MNISLKGIVPCTLLWHKTHQLRKPTFVMEMLIPDKLFLNLNFTTSAQNLCKNWCKKDWCELCISIPSDHDACSQQTCSASYTNSMQYVTRGSSPQYCSVLKTYLECMRQTDRACKGNLYYHSMSVLIINWMTQYNCTAMGLTPSPNIHRPGKTRSPVLTPTPTALRVCTYK